MDRLGIAAALVVAALAAPAAAQDRPSEEELFGAPAQAPASAACAAPAAGCPRAA